MLDSIVLLTGSVILAYVFFKTIKLNNEREKIRKELKIVYSIGLKEYNKSLCSQFNQPKIPITSQV